MMDALKARQLVAEAGKKLLAEGLTARTWGNISCRIDHELMAITPSGLAYDSMSPDDIVIMNINTGEWEGKHKPSSEKRIHIAAYRQFSDVGFVIHTHQIYASAMGLAGFHDLLISEEEKARLVGGIALSDYALPSTKELLKSVSRSLESGAHVVLMQNHGALIAGKDSQDAFDRAILLEEVCRNNTKGQPDSPPYYNEEQAKVFSAKIKNEFEHVGHAASPAILACASKEKPVRAQLDDMAQMIGAKLVIVPADEKKIVNALRKKNVILVPGIGVFCRAGSNQDVKALCMLAEKSCVSWLHTEAFESPKTLSLFDTLLMRIVYLKKYSKKIEG